MAGRSRYRPAWSQGQVAPVGQWARARALTGSVRGAGPPGCRRPSRSMPSACRIAHTVCADAGDPSACSAAAISVTERSAARSASTRSRIVADLRGPFGPGLDERKNSVRPARSSAASWCTVDTE